MKIMKYTALAILTAFMAMSCNDVVNIDEGWDPDNVSTGAPSVRKIAASSDTTTAITSAALNQSIAVFGENLTGLLSVRVNDLEVDLSQVYAKSHRLELVIPRKLPTAVTNKLYIVTELGETAADLNIVLPELVINGFKHEFAANEDTVAVTGNEFDLYMIDTLNATLNFNGQPVEMIECDAKSFKVQIPAGTPIDQTSYLTIESPIVKTPVSIPFREAGVPILTNDGNTWINGWWPYVITSMNDIPADDFKYHPQFLWITGLKKNFPGTWGYENVMITHFWLDSSSQDILNNPDDWCVKMEINNPAGTPLARYIRLGAAETENAGKFYMWDPASSNNGVALNTMSEWQTVQFEVTDLFPPLDDGQKTCLKISANPVTTMDDANNFKVAMQREQAGDVEFYFWNLRFVKKIKTN